MKPGRQGWLPILLYIGIGCVVYFGLVWQVITEAAIPAATPAWANPGTKAIRRISPVATAQNNPISLDNLDCTLMTYRLVATSTMQTGCFTETALGLLDSDTGVYIYNGTDEGLPLLSYSPHQVLVPWPGAADLVSLDASNNSGSYLSLYRNPLGVTRDQRNLLFQLTAKQLNAPPDLPLLDKRGQRLTINAQTMAFSDGGSWLVAEDSNGSFVRINLSTLSIKPFARSYVVDGMGPLKSRVAVSHDGHFVAIYNKEDDSLKVFDLTNCAITSVNLESENCLAYDYLPFIRSQINGLQSIRHVRFVNDGLLSFEAYTANPSSGGIYEIAPSAGIDSLIGYLGLGDSYTSGEGAFNYLAGTDTDKNHCHLSGRSYPLLLTHDLFSGRGGHSVACSGAVIRDINSNSDSYKGQVSGVLDFKHLTDTDPALLNSVITNFAPGYISQRQFVSQYLPNILTVSVGGNDIGFGNILETCVMPHISLHRSANDCFSSYEDRQEVLKLIDKTIPKWTTMLKRLKNASPRSQIYMIGYPQIAASGGNCALNVHMSSKELEFAQDLVDYLNAGIADSASKAGVGYIDISQALVGFRLCETASYNVAANGLTAGRDAGIFGVGMIGRESYHPNALGHQLIERVLLKQTSNFTSLNSATTGGKNLTKLLSAPKSGRIIVNRQPGKITSNLTKRGSSIAIKLTGANHGLKPNTAYSIRIDGSTGVLVGSANSNSSGDIDSFISLPSNIEPGGHSIDLNGLNQADETVDITQPIYVLFTDSDSDGDGVDNSKDSCPQAVNGGQDADKDGIDDTCDDLIGQPPSNPTSSSVPFNTSGSGLTIVASISNASSGNSGTPRQSIGNALGAATINPNSATAKKLTNNKSEASNTKRLQPPRIHPVNWLRWLLLAILVWLLLVVLGIILENYSDRRLQNQSA